MRVLITGIAGFAGSHLAELLVSKGWEVAGTSLEDATPNLISVAEKVQLYPCDLRFREAISVVIKDYRPEGIIHLAGFSSVGESFRNPYDAFENNVVGTLNLLEATKAISPETRVLVITSSDIYGKVAAKQLPIKETTPLNPASPYAASKACVDFIARQYFTSFGLSVVRVRPFNHTGPRQRLGFVVPDFAHQIARIETGVSPPKIKVGNLDSRRDFSDVRDTVRGYKLLLEKGQPGSVYHLASGKAIPIKKVLKILLSFSGKKISVEPDLAKRRLVDIPVMTGDAQKARKEVGWKPEIPLTKTLRDTLDFWREQIRK